ncbi:MAG: hypothetical protein WC464_07265 [Bdellovibrionales bacterium]
MQKALASVNLFAPQRLTISDDFRVAQVITSTAGTILLEDRSSSLEIGDCFYAPKKSPSTFYRLNALYGDMDGTEKNTITRYMISEDGGRENTFDIKVSYYDAASLSRKGKFFNWNCSSPTVVSVAENAIRKENVRLFSLPTDQKTVCAVELSSPLEGIKGYLAFTKQSYVCFNDANKNKVSAFVIPYDRTKTAIELSVKGTLNGFSGPITLNDEHVFNVLFQESGQSRIEIDEKPVKPVATKKIASIEKASRIPGVPFKPTPLTTPISSLIGRAPK